jgi:hypothetical protein
MGVLDIVTIAVLGFFAVRLVTAARRALRAGGRARTATIVRGLKPRHFALAPVAFAGVVVALVALLQIPVMRFGWWTAIGGLGNPVTGTTDRTAGTPLEWIIPVVFLTLLVPALPLFAEAEERIFRAGSEWRSFWGRAGKGLQFGLVHAIVGIPIGVALALSVGGWYFTWAYLRGYRASQGRREAAVLESTRAHLAYNVELLTFVALAILAAYAGLGAAAVAACVLAALGALWVARTRRAHIAGGAADFST